MLRPIALLTAIALASAAQATTMKPSAPDKMTSPDQAAKMKVCERKAAQQNVRMDARSKFVMDCMQAK